MATTIDRPASAPVLPESQRPEFHDRPWSTPLLGAVGVVAFMGIWELTSRLALVNADYLPPFSVVMVELVSLLVDPVFWESLGATMRSWLIGVALSLSAGAVIGLIIGSSSVLIRYTTSTVEFLRPIPSVALIPIAIVLFGINSTATVFVIVWACFWVILVHVMSGIDDVDPVAESTARSYGLGWAWRARYVTFPTALPFLMTGLRLCGTIALVVGITIELVVGTPGVGDLIATNQSAGNVTSVYALALLTGVLGLTINYGLKFIENRLLHWHPSVRSEQSA
ncbi:ABC transporter permease [Citricoccus sp. GCM10030269]|uniref:ABC transporter permease n=1 Tax=Citricoccus sp. GCM10030269 TaxID=3273388 RepID=UPI00360CE3A6